MNKTRRRKKRYYFQQIFILVLIFLVGIFLLNSFTPKKFKNNDLASSGYIQKINGKNKPINGKPTNTPSNTPSPTQIPTQTPTPVPAGYCITVPVLFYHHVQPLAIAKEHGNLNLTVDNTLFDTQMQYIVNQGYTTISAKQLVYALKNHTPLSAKSIVITLDDGYEDNYTYAFPIFQKYHLNASIMLATGLLNSGGDYMTWNHVQEMQKSGLVSFTDHTWSHYAVNHGTNEKIQYEIITAKQQIESNTGQTIDIFTYPYGSFDDNAIAILKQDGFLGAYSTLPGKLQCDSYIMSLHRTRIGNAPLSTYGL